MKTTRVEAITVYETDTVLYVRVETEAGVSGVGECSRMNNAVVARIIETTVKPEVIGMDLFASELIEHKVMSRHYKISGQLLAMAFSGVEIALWDARARLLGQPVYNLLGGRFREAIPVYASLTLRDYTLEQECEFLKDQIERHGFQGVKIKIGPRMGATTGMVDLDADVEKVATVRRALGSQVRIMVDANSSYSFSEALRLYERIAEYGIHHYEEPCPYWDVESYIKLAQRVTVPIHVGEQDWNIYTFRDFISRGACHLYAVDPVKCGGLANAKRAATLCRAFGVTYVPHNTSRGVGLAAMIALAASTPEFNYYGEYKVNPASGGEQYLDSPFQVHDGMIAVPGSPGLGVELDWEKLEREATVHR